MPSLTMLFTPPFTPPFTPQFTPQFTPSTARSTVRAALVAALLVAATACGGTTQQPAADPTAATSTSSSPDASTSSPEPSGSASPEGSPVTTRSADVDGHHVTLGVYAVQRENDLATLTYTLTVGDEQTSGSGLQVGEHLSDGDPDTSDADGLAADGVKMLDTGHKKVYLVASDGQGHCLCTRDTSNVFVRPGGTVSLSATYAAPPEGVDAVSLVFPLFGTVSGVPVR